MAWVTHPKLLDEFEKHKVGSRVVIVDFVFHYILSPTESPPSDRPNVWSPVARPSARPNVTAIAGIRSSFCFRVADSNVLAVRELSCRCKNCITRQWTLCKNRDAGPWRHVTMTSSAASTRSISRSQRSVISSDRQRLAKGVRPNELIAMESADDEEGFRFWLATAVEGAFQYRGAHKVVDGRKMVPGGWYIKIQYYDRYPATSESTFKLGSQISVENAEGVISRNVQKNALRATRRSQATVISLAAEEIQRLNDLRWTLCRLLVDFRNNSLRV